MGKKERILELIKEFDGLTYNKIIDLYNERFKPNSITKEMGYVFLQRLRNNGLITSEPKDDVKGKCYFYKPTPKALNQDLEDTKMKGLKFYDNLFKNNLNYLMKSKEIVKEILNNSELTEKIDKVVN